MFDIDPDIPGPIVSDPLLISLGYDVVMHEARRLVKWRSDAVRAANIDCFEREFYGPSGKLGQGWELTVREQVEPDRGLWKTIDNLEAWLKQRKIIGREFIWVTKLREERGMVP
ncbi:uncharacterized protein LTR77_009284 [Saxophila tyrrhenica]|uniref:Uncharacterized protein n=1 Tax=Saxophila tyrrhenica TaxID=1690608 RepID=A0AAV9NYL8_9PEZI|nr:hypothetical protein LTR77_009284 [Saxophila tyrrhenica]